MAFDFPASPTDQQVYLAPNGRRYTYLTASGGWTQEVPAAPTLGSPFKRTYVVNSTTTFQYDPLTLFADVEVLGGGGNGGGTGTSAANTGSGAAGGGAGGYAKKLIQITPSIRATTKSISIGAAGGNSTYGDGTHTLNGFAGGAGVSGTHNATFVARTGGGGGGANGGDVNIGGAPGFNSFGLGPSVLGSTNGGGFGGNGGSSQYGGGGRAGQVTTTPTPTKDDGNPGSGFGAGGGGAAASGAVSSAGQPGAGSQGVVIITEYR